jgi:hypothetical protein
MPEFASIWEGGMSPLIKQDICSFLCCTSFRPAPTARHLLTLGHASGAGHSLFSVVCDPVHYHVVNKGGDTTH